MNQLSGSPVINAIIEKGRKAHREGRPRIPPYTSKTSGPRWRTFAHAWLDGWDLEQEKKAEENDD